MGKPVLQGREVADMRSASLTTSRKDDPVLREIVRRIVSAYHPDKIYLFGSTARAEAGPDSDYDLMITIPDDAPEELRRCDAAYRAVRDLDRSGDFLVWTRTAFLSRARVPSSLPATVLREGVLLYAAR